MTKLKKKKSKKRAKKSYPLDQLCNDDVFVEFCESIKSSTSKKDPKNRVPFSAYQWALSEEVSGSLKELAEIFKSGKSSSHSGQLDVADIYQTAELEGALELLAAVWTLTRHPKSQTAEQASNLLIQVCEAFAKGDDDLLTENPIVHQILYGEIPLTIGIQFPVLEVAEDLVVSARSELITAVEELLDGDGLPNAIYLSQSGMLLACWTRCFMLCDFDNRECFDVDAQTQFEFFIRQMMRLVRRDGTMVFSEDSIDLRKPILSALACYFDEDDRNIAAVVFPKKGKTGSLTKKGKSKKISLNSLPESSAYSEWAEVACLQTEWLPESPRMTIVFQGQKLWVELATDCVLFSGEMRHQFWNDDQQLAVVSDWEVVCWHSDQDGDFLELECDLENGAKWQKHFLLARNETFCLIGDVLINGVGEVSQIESKLPLGQGIGFGAARETREMFLTNKANTVAAVLPVSLPEWREQKCDSDLSVNDHVLTLQDKGKGINLYCPLVIDLDPKRCRKPLTWRQLTVAEKLETVSPSTAAAFRGQVGSHQWVIYRSLAETANRTFMGQNLNVEFYVGSLEEDGTSSEIISVN